MAKTDPPLVFPLSTQHSELIGARAAAPARYLVLLPFLIIVLVIGGHGVGLGLASHNDARSIFERSVPAILGGGYEISRSYGVPLYEFIATGLYALGGIWLAEAYSLLLALGTLLLFDRMLPETLNIAQRLWLLAGLTLSPLFLINASTFFEWMQLLFLTAALVLAVFRWTTEATRRLLLAIGLASAALLLTRPDTAITIAGCFLAAAIRPERTLRQKIDLAVTFFLGGLAALLVYVSLNRGFGFLRYDALGDSDLLHRVEHAGLGIAIVLGPAGLVAVALAMADILRDLAPGRRRPPGFFGVLFLVAAPLAMLRFAALPTKIEYVISLPLFLLLAMGERHYRASWNAVVAVSLCYISFVSISCLEHGPGEDRLHVHLRLNDGALGQDWVATDYEWRVLTDPDFRRRLAKSLFPDTAPVPELNEETYGAGLTTDQGDLLLGAGETYKLDNPREQENFQRRLYRRIYVCDRAMAWDNVGWRLLEPALIWPNEDNPNHAFDVKCRLESSPQ